MSDKEIIADIAQVINRHSLENGSDTPDFLLAEMLLCQIRTWNQYVNRREKWYGRKPGLLNNLEGPAVPGQQSPVPAHHKD